MENSQDHEDRTVTSDNRVENQLTATKVSYTHPLWGGSISVGGEYTYTNRHDDYVNQEGYVPTTYTRIREQNLAGYAQYNHPYHSVRQTLACDMSMWILIILKMVHLYPDKAVYMIISFQIFL